MPFLFFEDFEKGRHPPIDTAYYPPADLPAEALAGRLEPATPFLAPDLPALPLFALLLVE